MGSPLPAKDQVAADPRLVEIRGKQLFKLPELLLH